MANSWTLFLSRLIFLIFFTFLSTYVYFSLLILGLAVMVLMIPLNGVVAAKMKKFQISQMLDKDRRCKLMDEILNGIKVLKLYAWERSFEGKVNEIRKTEAGALIKGAFINHLDKKVFKNTQYWS